MREVKAVYATPASGGMFNVRVALNQRVPGEARNAIAAVFGSLANTKHVFVVDPDIDIFSDEQVDWAFATRFQADRDLVVARGHARPAARSFARRREHRGEGRLRPHASALRRAHPWNTVSLNRRNFDGRRFDSLQAALADGPKFFAELMAADRQPRRARDRARARGLARSGKLSRDNEGRYQVIG